MDWLTIGSLWEKSKTDWTEKQQLHISVISPFYIHGSMQWHAKISHGAQAHKIYPNFSSVLFKTKGYAEIR